MGEGERVVKKIMPVCIPAGYWKRQADLCNCLLSCFLQSAQFNDLPFGMKQL